MSHPHTAFFSVCTECGELIVPKNTTDINYFGLFNIPVTYFVDLGKIQSRFYDLSRILHPDKVQNKTSDEIVKATQWFAYLTTALNTLKSPDERAQYLFDLARFSLPQTKSTLPPALAEDYFELQESLEENPENKEPIKEFVAKVNREMSSAESDVEKAFQDWESDSKSLNGKASPFFQRAALAIQKKAYLKSMSRDLEKKWL